MRTNFTSEDIKNIVDTIFNGNLWASKASNGSVAYSNPNSEPINLINEDDGTSETADLAEYLNIHFYNWKQRLVEKDDNEQPYSVLEDWVQSLNFSMNESYALVEKTDEEVTASQDIDSATITSKVTFLIQTNKVKNLDYYITKIRNAYLGVPQEIQNSYGEKLKAFIMVGALIYDEEPFETQLGECIIASINIKLTYLNNAFTYSDTEFSISLDGDDDSKYLTLPITKVTFQNVFTSTPLTMSARPDLTGFIASSATTAITLTFYDFDKELTNRFNELFWSSTAYKIDNTLTTARDVNIPVFVKVVSNGKTYVFKDIIENMQKVFTNNDFTISSITLKGYGKVTQ